MAQSSDPFWRSPAISHANDAGPLEHERLLRGSVPWQDYRINALWIGEHLSLMEQLTLRSFLACGHGVTLWVYSPMADRLADALGYRGHSRARTAMARVEAAGGSIKRTLAALETQTC